MERVRVTVPSAKAGDAFVTYTVCVVKGELSWSVTRRFADFERLHVSIRRVVAAEQLPDLPSKALLRMGASKFAPDFVEQRRKGLEAYLDKLVGVAEPERVEALDDFLEYAEHCASVRWRGARGRGCCSAAVVMVAAARCALRGREAGSVRCGCTPSVPALSPHCASPASRAPPPMYPSPRSPPPAPQA